MYKYFNKIITMGRSNIWGREDYKFYTSVIEEEIKSLDRLIKFSADSPDGQSHIDFIQSYKSLFQNHINYVKSVMESMEFQSEELLDVLNGSDGAEGVYASENLGYFWNVEFDTLYFLKQLEFDDYLKLQAFLIIEVESTPRGYRVQQHSLGFTNLDINEIRNEPSFIKKQIEKFSTIDNLEGIYSHKDYCEDLLLKFFGVQKIQDLIKIEESTVTKLLGTPLELWREIRGISNFMIIKTSLPKRLKDNFNVEIQELIEVEVRINNKDNYKEIFEEEDFTKYCEKLYSRKSELMNSLSFQQKQLEEYMSYLPKEFN